MQLQRDDLPPAIAQALEVVVPVEKLAALLEVQTREEKNSMSPDFFDDDADSEAEITTILAARTTSHKAGL